MIKKVIGLMVCLSLVGLVPAFEAIGNQEYPTVAFDGTNYLVVWQDYRNGNWDIYGSQVDQSGVVLQPSAILISNATNNQQYPAVGFDGANYLVVWRDLRNGSTGDIYGARVRQDGVVLDPDGFPISTATDWQTSPAIAFGDSNYLIVWTDERSGYYTDIYGARVNLSGLVLDPNGISISTAINDQYFASLAFDGINYLVVWQDLRSEVDIFGARVNQAGMVLDPNGIAISTAVNWQILPSVAFDTTNYLVIWQDQRSGNSDIYGTRLTSAGVVLDPSGTAVSTATDDQGHPNLAFDSADYFVAWDDERSGPCDIYGSRVNQGGTVIDTNGAFVSVIVDTQWHPSITFGGNYYFIVWEDGRGYDNDIYGARVNLNGVVIDTNGILISVNVGLENTKEKLYLNSFRLSIFPNPAKNVMHVRYPWFVEEQTDIKIFDVSGKLVKEEKVKSAQKHKQEIKISLKGINPGIYFLQFENEIRKFLVVRQKKPLTKSLTYFKLR